METRAGSAAIDNCTNKKKFKELQNTLESSQWRDFEEEDAMAYGPSTKIGEYSSKAGYRLLSSLNQRTDDRKTIWQLHCYPKIQTFW